MASSASNANHPPIPGRCDICENLDGKRKMNFVQCSKCKVCVHRECYMVYPQDDVEDFVCYACAAIGRTYQAVDTHLGNRIYEIEQKERPVECALCSVKDGMHAMYPLFDYHGKGGRQICVTVKSKNGNSGERKLVWAHALCALYLSSLGFMYACFKDGEYVGMEEDDFDSRSPNPELEITNKFKRMYGEDAMSHFRYYMTPPNGVLDMWTKAVLDNKKELKCIECGLMDGKKSMRIPIQCVANDPDEFEDHRNKHRQRNNDVLPCTQALHVGCARWGDPSSTIRKLYFWPGTTDQDGSIVSNIDTVHCIYCKNHAENVDEEHQKKVKQNTALLEKKRAVERDRLFQQSATRIKAMIPKAVDSSAHVSKNITKRPAASIMRDGSTQGMYNSDEQPKLPKRQRIMANNSSNTTKGDVNKILDDLISHQDDILRNRESVMKDRKRYWKHQLSNVSKADFDVIWMKAQKKFQKRQTRKANLGSGTTNSNNDDDPVLLHSRSSLSIEDGGKLTQQTKTISNDNNTEPENHFGSFDGNTTGRNFNASENDEIEQSEGDLKIQNPQVKSKSRKRKEYPPDRWSNLFIGQGFTMGNEFTRDAFREKT